MVLSPGQLLISCNVPNTVSSSPFVFCNARHVVSSLLIVFIVSCVTQGLFVLEPSRFYFSCDCIQGFLCLSPQEKSTTQQLDFCSVGNTTDGNTFGQNTVFFHAAICLNTWAWPAITLSCQDSTGCMIKKSFQAGKDKFLKSMLNMYMAWQRHLSQDFPIT